MLEYTFILRLIIIIICKSISVETVRMLIRIEVAIDQICPFHKLSVWMHKYDVKIRWKQNILFLPITMYIFLKLFEEFLSLLKVLKSEWNQEYNESKSFPDSNINWKVEEK